MLNGERGGSAVALPAFRLHHSAFSIPHSAFNIFLRYTSHWVQIHTVLMEILRGISVAPGVAIGEAVVLEAEDYRIPHRTVPAEEMSNELSCLASAFEKSLEELEKQAVWLNAHLGHDAANVFEWHIGVLKDERLRGSIETMIRAERAAAAYAASTVMRKYQQRFMQMSDPLLVERIRDVQDIERRVLRNILGEAREDLAHLSKPVILVAHDLTPTQTAQLAETKVAGVALDAGAATSHTAILLRSLGRPKRRRG